MKWDDVKPVTWTNAAGFAFSDKGAYYRRTDVEQARAADAEQHTKLQLMWQNQIRTIDDLQEQNDLLRHQINELNSLVQWHEEHQTHLKALLSKETA